MTTKFAVFGLVAVFALPTGFAEAKSGKTQTINPKMEKIVRRMQPPAYAKIVAKNCRGLKLDKAKVKAYQSEANAFANGLGYFKDTVRHELWTNQDAYKAFAEAEAAKFVKENGIVQTDRKSWCAAGERLIASGSPVGQFLKRR